jgi:Homeodomain-like domain
VVDSQSMDDLMGRGRDNALRQLRVMCERHDAKLRAGIITAVRAGARSQEIAQVLGISRATAWRRYGTELRRDAQQAVQAVSEAAKPRAVS